MELLSGPNDGNPAANNTRLLCEAINMLSCALDKDDPHVLLSAKGPQKHKKVMNAVDLDEMRHKLQFVFSPAD